MAEMMSRSEAAALLGVTVQALDRALGAGRIFYADAGRKLFDRAALLAQWAENRKRRRKPVPAGVAVPIPVGESEAELRRRLLAADAHMAELALAEKRGLLVMAADVQTATFAGMRALRDNVLSVPDRLAAMLAAEADVVQVHALLTAALKEALRATAEALSGAAANGDGAGRQ